MIEYDINLNNQGRRSYTNVKLFLHSYSYLFFWFVMLPVILAVILTCADSARVSDSDPWTRQKLVSSVKEFTDSLLLKNQNGTVKLNYPIYSEEETIIEPHNEYVSLKWNKIRVGPAKTGPFDQMLSGSPQWRELPRTTKLIHIANNDLNGTITFPTLTILSDLDISNNKLSGSADFLSQAPNLMHANLSNNTFSGSLHTSTLPNTLITFNISKNRFSGPLDMSSLPQSLEVLDLSNNDFHGSIVLDRLPCRLTTLLLFFNYLSGPLDLTHLSHDFLFNITRQCCVPPCKTQSGKFVSIPQCLKLLDVSHNEFEGDVNVQNVPSSLQELDLSYNRFSGEPLLPETKSALVKLDMSHNRLYGNARLIACGMETEVNLSYNFFSGFLIPPRKPDANKKLYPQKPEIDLLLAFKRNQGEES